MVKPQVEGRKTSIAENYFAPGDFSFMTDKFKERYLSKDYIALNKLGSFAWDFIENGKLEGPIIKQIREECWEDHTDSTFMNSMKDMKFIAEFGWDTYANCVCPDLW